MPGKSLLKILTMNFYLNLYILYVKAAWKNIYTVYIYALWFFHHVRFCYYCLLSELLMIDSCTMHPWVYMYTSTANFHDKRMETGKVKICMGKIHNMYNKVILSHQYLSKMMTNLEKFSSGFKDVTRHCRCLTWIHSHVPINVDFAFYNILKGFVACRQHTCVFSLVLYFL